MVSRWIQLGAISIIIFLAAISLALPLFWTYVETGLVPRLPTAVLVSGLSIVSLLTFLAGLFWNR